MSDEVTVEVRCHAPHGSKRQPHRQLLATITLGDSPRGHQVRPRDGIRWSVSETEAGATLWLTCPRHGAAEGVPLAEARLRSFYSKNRVWPVLIGTDLTRRAPTL